MNERGEEKGSRTKGATVEERVFEQREATGARSRCATSPFNTPPHRGFAPPRMGSWCSIKTKESAQSSELGAFESFREKVGNIVIGFDIGDFDLARLCTFTEEVILDIEMFDT
jgi:hypothetical protein